MILAAIPFAQLEDISKTSSAQPSFPPLFTRTRSFWLTGEVFYGIIRGSVGLDVIILAVTAQWSM
jgi:hypothetical protein